MRHRERPLFCVWELTLECNAACVHCGSSAGRRRPAELDGKEALELCGQLASLGVERVTLSGGEPLLRPDWPGIARRLVEGGVAVDMISNGIALDGRASRLIAELGLKGVSLSIDGPEEVHDELRGAPGGFRAAMEGARLLRAGGVPVGAVTQINRHNAAHLARLEEALAGGGFLGWQLQLTMPIGRTREHDGLVVGPEEVPGVIRFVLEARKRGRIRVYAADNIGWMTRDEPLIRSGEAPARKFYAGCHAGLSLIGITSEGDVRGCLSMPGDFNEGSLRRRPLADLWNDPDAFPYNRKFRVEDLTGRCAACPFRRVCRGGCKCMAFSSTGGLGENIYCARDTAPV